LISFINVIWDNHKNDKVKGIMLVAPNSGFIYKMLRYFSREKIIPRQLEITYFRSDKTVGVSSELRTMIAICPPYPPSNSFDWLAQYYHEYGFMKDLTIREIGDRLEKMNAFQTFYQTIGRVKSPDLDTRSVVYTWGIGMDDLHTLLGKSDKDVPQPHLLFSDINNGWKNIIPKMGKMWKQSKLKVDESVMHLINKIEYGNINVNRWTVKRILKMYGRNRAQKKVLEDTLLKTDTKILEYLGIFISRSNTNTYVTYKPQEE
jgi:hypothetical protein